MNKDAIVVALVPMKHTSVRVRGKNYRMFQGQPLCYWVLKTLRACPQITQIVVDTDSKEIIEMLAKDFPAVEQGKNSDLRVPPIVLLDRPAELLNDPPMNEILLHDTAVFPADFYLQVRASRALLQQRPASKAHTAEPAPLAGQVGLTDGCTKG